MHTDYIVVTDGKDKPLQNNFLYINFMICESIYEQIRIG